MAYVTNMCGKDAKCPNCHCDFKYNKGDLIPTSGLKSFKGKYTLYCPGCGVLLYVDYTDNIKM